MENKFSKIILIIKSKKRPIFIFVFILFLIALFYNLTQKNNEKAKISNTPSPTSKFSVENNKVFIEPKRSNPAISYQFNRFESLTNILGYTWNGNKIVYATKDGVFKLWKNEKVVNTNIDYVNFNANGQGIYSNNNDYFFFDSRDNSTFKIGSNLNKSQVDNKGENIIYQDANSLKLRSLNNGDIKTLNLTENSNISFGWVENKDLFYVYNKNTNEINSYDLNIKLFNIIKVKSTDRFLSFNPEADKYLTSQNGRIDINDFSNSSSTSVSFTQGAKFYSYWINSTEFVLVETVERSNLGLFDDFIWKVNTNGEKVFLANSYPIPNKLNLNTKIFINQNKNTLIFSENKGRVWTLSLRPSEISTYSEEGVSFYTLPPSSRED